jgi:transketolase
MRGTRYGYGAGWKERYGWAVAYPIEPRLISPAQRKPAHTKLEHATTMHQRWSKKAKTAQTLAKQWERKMRYYQQQQGEQRNAKRITEHTHREYPDSPRNSMGAIQEGSSAAEL